MQTNDHTLSFTSCPFISRQIIWHARDNDFFYQIWKYDCTSVRLPNSMCFITSVRIPHGDLLIDYLISGNPFARALVYQIWWSCKFGQIYTVPCYIKDAIQSQNYLLWTDNFEEKYTVGYFAFQKVSGS